MFAHSRSFVVFSLVSRGSNVQPAHVHMHTYRSVFACPKMDTVSSMATSAATSNLTFDVLPAGIRSLNLAIFAAMSGYLDNPARAPHRGEQLTVEGCQRRERAAGAARGCRLPVRS